MEVSNSHTMILTLCYFGMQIFLPVFVSRFARSFLSSVKLELDVCSLAENGILSSTTRCRMSAHEVFLPLFIWRSESISFIPFG